MNSMEALVSHVIVQYRVPVVCNLREWDELSHHWKSLSKCCTVQEENRMNRGGRQHFLKQQAVAELVTACWHLEPTDGQISESQQAASAIKKESKCQFSWDDNTFFMWLKSQACIACIQLIFAGLLLTFNSSRTSVLHQVHHCRRISLE